MYRYDNDTAVDHRSEQRAEDRSYFSERESYEYVRQSDRYND